MKRISLILLTGLFILALFPRCAKVVAPTGGPKDTLAPNLINSNPLINSVNFSENEIFFEFDEYILVKDIQQKLLVSPPLKNRPEVKVKGKKIIVEISDTLRENTTYTIYMGDAVSDNNENNPIKSFEFAFSTGANIDTLSLTGSIINSFSKEPVEGALIMLYDTFEDSLPYMKTPTHIAKANKKGEFKVNNLKRIDYKLVAITDGNSNYMYNQGAEDIAFLDKPFKKEYFTDSTKKTKMVLRSFIEEMPNQILTGFGRPNRRQIELNFSRKPVGGFKLTLLDEPKEKSWFIPEPDPQGDTIKIWITSDKIALKDTLRIIASYKKTDSLYVLHAQTDTLKLVYTDIEEQDIKSKSKKKGGEESKLKEDFNFIASVIDGAQVKPDVPFEFTLPMPAKKIDESRLLIFNETDSVMEPPVNIILSDSLNPRIYRFHKAWEAKKSYKLLMLPGIFESLESLKNDTIRLSVVGADPEDYGTLIIKTDKVSKGLIAELLTEKGLVVDHKSIVGNQTITFTYITPGKYKLRFIEDLNKNGMWDSGNYLKKRQPERIFDFTEGKNKGEINIRANWENEIQFSIPNP